MELQVLAGPRGAGRPAQRFYTQQDQLLTIDNLSRNEFQAACEAKSERFHPENGRGLG
jgi:hypothetical protein